MGPVVQQEMKRLGYGGPVLTHWQALKLVFLTPRIYEDTHTLVSPNGEKQTELSEFWSEIDASEGALVEAVAQREFGEEPTGEEPSTVRPPHFPVDEPAIPKREAS